MAQKDEFPLPPASDPRAVTVNGVHWWQGREQRGETVPHQDSCNEPEGRLFSYFRLDIWITYQPEPLVFKQNILSLSHLINKSLRFRVVLTSLFPLRFTHVKSRIG